MCTMIPVPIDINRKEEKQNEVLGEQRSIPQTCAVKHVQLRMLVGEGLFVDDVKALRVR